MSCVLSILNLSLFNITNSHWFHQVAQQTSKDEGANILSSIPVDGQGPAVVTESTNFPPEGLGPDFAQAFSDQPFQVTSATEQQEQEESTFAQNTLVHTLAPGMYVVCIDSKYLLPTLHSNLEKYKVITNEVYNLKMYFKETDCPAKVILGSIETVTQRILLQSKKVSKVGLKYYFSSFAICFKKKPFEVLVTEFELFLVDRLAREVLQHDSQNLQV